MRAMLLFALALSFCLGGLTGEHYVAANGSDQNSGSAEAPWATLGRAARARGTVLLRRGDVFRESAELGGGIALGAYGPPHLPLPVIAGSIEIKGWKEHQKPIWVAAVAKPVEQVFANGKLLWLARYPNEGCLRTQQGSTSALVVDATLAKHPRNAADYWKGANVRWRKWSWWYETRPVTGYDPQGRLSLGGKTFLDHTGIGSGYYLDNKLEELDAPGEWYFDEKALKVYLRAPGDADPNTLLVEGSALKNGLSIGEGTIEQVAFRHQTGTGLSVNGKAVVKGCRFEGIGGADGGTALAVSWNGHGTQIRQCVFEDNLNVGIAWNQDPKKEVGGSLIEECVLRRTGMVEGYGGSGSWHATGIIVSNGNGIVVRRCVIEETGYAGIIPGSAGNTVENCFFRRNMATLNDGGAIYTCCNRTTIRNNIVLETVGNLETSHPWANLGHGIWLEFLDDFRESMVEGNIVAGCGGFGLFLPNNFECQIRNNLFFDNARAQMELSGEERNERTRRTQNLPQKHTIEGNILFAGNEKQATLLFRPEFDYGTLKDNYFCNPFSKNAVTAWGAGGNRWSQGGMDLAQWQAKYAWADKTARTDTEKFIGAQAAGVAARLFVNDTAAPKEFSLNGPWRDVDGRPAKSPLTLEPYRGAVLLGPAGNAAVLPRYVLASQQESGAQAGKAGTAGAGASPARSPAAAPPKPKADEETVKAWTERLRARVKTVVAAQRLPQFVTVRPVSKITIRAIDDDGEMQVTIEPGLQTVMKWSKLDLPDLESLAVALTAKDAEPEDHALAAFFLYLAGKSEKAYLHVGQAGAAARDVEAVFAK